MGGEWHETTLGDVVTLQRGFDLPITKRTLGPYPVIASTGKVGDHSQAMVKGPGVVIGRSGSIGGGQYIMSDFWPLNTTLWVKDFKGNDGMVPPFIVMVSLLGCKDAYMSFSTRENPSGEVCLIESDCLIIPEVIIDEQAINMPQILRPIFDAIWNACGYPRSMSYDEKGNWRYD